MGKQTVFQVTTLEALFKKSTWNESVLASIATGFGTFTLIFTCVGVYALVNLTAGARRREIGIRMALGANRSTVVRCMLKDMARVAASGACAGWIASFVVMRVYRSFLYGNTELDPILILSAAGIVVLSAFAAAILQSGG
jgi:ABC-type antimicrobial peptide transport system permease subunit